MNIMRFLRNVIALLLAVLFGFWLASAGILTDTKTGDVMDTIVSYLPDRKRLERSTYEMNFRKLM